MGKHMFMIKAMFKYNVGLPERVPAPTQFNAGRCGLVHAIKEHAVNRVCYKLGLWPNQVASTVPHPL